MIEKSIVLGAGMTGLAAGLAGGATIFEGTEAPGGICSSYHLAAGGSERLAEAPFDGEAYRFEIGGGHWIFGGDPAVLRFIRSLTPVKSYSRVSGVYFSRENLSVPYPLQNHLSYLGRQIAMRALSEMAASSFRNIPASMAEWLEQSFGKTLTELFFGPFHELYTSGLWTRIAPQDDYKSPVSYSLALQGAFEKAPPVGYNVTFIYPANGLNTLGHHLAERCRVCYGKTVAAIDTDRREVSFTDGSEVRYGTLISTLPLNRMVELTQSELDAQTDPYTSVLVLNIGAVRGPGCPDDHWLYIPDSRSGFHRVGFYSNVDASFLPASSRTDRDRVSIYVERSYPGGQKPSEEEIRTYAEKALGELREWGFIGEAEVVDPTWIDVAYTWSWPGSKWKQLALKTLEEKGIYQVGRYGRWAFQGIADSIRDGFIAGASLRLYEK